MSALQQSADFLRRLVPQGTQPAIAIVLGSGMNSMAQLLAHRSTCSFADVPGFPPATVPGHAGEIHAGTLNSNCVIVVAGRTHLYEGQNAEGVAYVTRTLATLGISQLLLCNAAGGISNALQPGSIMLITDVINFTFRSPLVGAKVPGELRFPDMSQPFDSGMNEGLRLAARSQRIVLHEGTYAGVLGPSYETKAEIQMLARLGADAVGMSTLQEVITARARNMRCAALSCITNRAAGLSSERLSHERVLQVAEAARDQLATIIEHFAPL